MLRPRAARRLPQAQHRAAVDLYYRGRRGSADAVLSGAAGLGGAGCQVALVGVDNNLVGRPGDTQAKFGDGKGRLFNLGFARAVLGCASTGVSFCGVAAMKMK